MKFLQKYDFSILGARLIIFPKPKICAPKKLDTTKRVHFLWKKV